MKDIIKIIKLDTISIYPYLTIKNLLIIIILSIFYSFSAKSTTVIFGITQVFAVLFSSYPFLVGNESGIDSLYGILGIKRENVVYGRYIWSMLINIFGIVLGIIFGSIISIFLKTDFIVQALVISLTIFFMSSIVILIQYPLFFKYGYAKAKTVMSMLIIGVAIIGLSVMYFKETLIKVIEFVASNILISIILFILLYLAINFLSIKLSVKYYKEREF